MKDARELEVFNNTWSDVRGASERDVDNLIVKSGCKLDPFTRSMLIRLAGGYPKNGCYYRRDNNGVWDMEVGLGHILLCSPGE